MPRRSVRNRRRAVGGLLSFLIGALFVAALALICAIVVRYYVPGDKEAEQPQVSGDSFVDINDLPDTDLVLKADNFSEEYLPGQETTTATPGPDRYTPTPRPMATLAPVGAGDVAAPTASAEGFLPIYSRAGIKEKIIAITLDECSSVKLMGDFINIARHFDAKLTLFPTGESIMKNGMGDVLKKCLLDYGYEIENRGYSPRVRLYQCSETMMVQQIWKQSVALNYVLGMRYQPHFYRLYGGVGENDPRTHAYLSQEGYLGIAHWTADCSAMDVDKVADKLMPGGVYVFRVTEEDAQRMYTLMSAARDQGYRMVTMNQLFDLPDNTYAAEGDSLLADTMPEFDYGDALYDLTPGEASWAVMLLQQRLITLGYLPVKGGADGIYGDNTAVAVRAFQANVGVLASGIADVNTQERLYSPDAPKNSGRITDLFPTRVPDGYENLLDDASLVPSSDFGGEIPRDAADGAEEN